ncbi:MAG: aminopeptidase N [Gammaproteobacteria bacterium]|nr:aminopeptidase N [Gammaproteobacteria bacterium]
MRDAQARVTRLRDYRAPDFLIDRTELHFDLRPGETLVRATLALRANPGHPVRARELRLHGEGLQLRELALDGRALAPAEYSYSDGELVIPDVPAVFELSSTVAIHPEANTSLEGLYQSRGLYCTQCEAEGFRKITFYLDRPDVLSEFTTTIEADQGAFPVLLSNGNPVAEGAAPGGRHWVTWHDPFQKPAYLFALVAGDLACMEDSFTTASGRNVALRIYVEPKDLDKLDHAMYSLKQAMAWDERRFGLEYDLDIFMIVAVDDFNMGAMENKGLNIFNTSCVLAHPETTTDLGFQRVEAVVAHEYFHNWSGNRVTCRDWFQLSLKEGFTVFRDSEFSADMGSRTIKRVEDVNLLRTAQFAEDAGPTAHPVQPDAYQEISNFYTVTIYEKGAEVVRMIHTLLGPDAFRRGCDLYFERHDGAAVTIEDFVAAMAEASGRDFSQFMGWYRQAGTPRVAVRGHYDAGAQTYRLDFTQSCPPTPECADKAPFQIPIRLGLVGRNGDLPLHVSGLAEGATDIVFELTESTQSLVFERVGEAPIPSLLRGFSAPVKLAFDYDRDELVQLLRRDSDGFNRWEAGNRLAVGILQELIADDLAGRPLALDARLVEAYRELLTDPALDPALVAHILTLPGEAYLSELAEIIEVEAIHRARQFARRELAQRLRPEFEALYTGNRSAESYRANAEQIARRSLHNLALAYLLQLEVPELIDRAWQQFDQADNMTDTNAALVSLLNNPAPQAQDHAREALGRYYARWQSESLVVNQWFQMQAWCVLPGGLERVRALLAHPAFDLRNPNKVRSVIGAFSAGNPVNFHRADGAGYAFLVEQVLTLDAMNPQIAARLLTPLTRWRKYPQARAGAMRAALEQVLVVPELSKDSFEIASKALR